MVHTRLQDYYRNTTDNSNNLVEAVDLQINQNNKNPDHTLQEILEYGLKDDSVGKPLYPAIKRICITGVSLKAHQLPTLQALVKDKHVEALEIHRMPLHYSSIITLCDNLLTAKNLKTLRLSEIGLQSSKHADSINQLIRSLRTLTQVDLEDRQFDNSLIDQRLLSKNQCYQQAVQVLPKINSAQDEFELLFMKQSFYKALKSFKSQYALIVSTKQQRQDDKNLYNQLLATGSYCIGAKYQDFGFPEDANPYFERVIEGPECAGDIKGKAQELFGLNKLADACQFKLDEKPHKAIVPLAQAAVAALDTNDISLFERSRNTLYDALSNMEQKLVRNSL